MASVFEYERDAVRVKARYTLPTTREEVSRKFSVDPNLTSYETLRSLLSRAFDLQHDAFKLYYHYVDDEWFPLVSDWDLDAAIISASEPWMQLELVFCRASSSSAEDSDAAACCDFEPPTIAVDRAETERSAAEGEEEEEAAAVAASSSSSFLPSPETIQSIVTTSNKAGISFFNQTIPALTKRLQKALATPEEGESSSSSSSTSNLPSPTKLLLLSPTSSPTKAARPPLTDKEFRSFLDNVGELVMPKELRVAIYRGGVEPQLRKVVWKHLLGVYPRRMNGKERMAYMKQKCAQYESLRRDWTSVIAQGMISCPSNKAAEELRNITNMVRKDVLRTDRQHKFYAGDGNANVTALFNILTTFALNHSSVGYCQGMSDLLSPLLVTMTDEAQAYVSFCALMQRLKGNFMIDGIAMTKKFQHLTDGLMYYDPEFYAYLKTLQADDLLFCYRWLLLEMKREFDMDDSFKVLEVLWSSLPPTHPEDGGLPLFETMFSTRVGAEAKPADALSSSSSSSSSGRKPRTPSKLTAYSKVASARRRAINSSSENRKQQSQQPQRPRIRSVGTPTRTPATTPTTKMVKSHSLMSAKSKASGPSPSQMKPSFSESGGRRITDLKAFRKLASEEAKSSSCSDPNGSDSSELDCGGDDSAIASKAPSLDDDDTVGYSHLNAVSGTAASASSSAQVVTLVCEKLPAPVEFGDGNPFLIFLCIACLLQHRGHIMKQGLDYQEIAMFFDRLVRKHDVERTLSFARRLFADYLNDDWLSSAAATTASSGGSRQGSPQKRKVSNGKAEC